MQRARAAGNLPLLGTSTTSLVLGTGSKVFTTQAGRGWSVGQNLKAVDPQDSTRYMFGEVTSYIGDQLTLAVTTYSGSGTNDDWSINIAGGVGAFPLSGTSGTSIVVDTLVAGNNITLTTETGRGWTVNQDLKIADVNDPGRYIYGRVSSYDSGPTLVVTVTSFNGTGTGDDWLINVAGGTGGPGADGASGTSRATTVDVAANGNVDILGGGLIAGQAVDGRTLAAGDKVLLPRQTVTAQNGIFTAPAANSAITAIGTASSVSGSTSLAITITTTAAVGDDLLVIIGADNAATTGGHPYSSVTDGANPYTAQRIVLNNPGINAGTAFACYSALNITTQIAASSAITVNLAVTTTAKVGTVFKLTPVSGSDISLVDVGVGNAVSISAGGGTWAADPVSVQFGDVIFGFYSVESNAGGGADNDTTSGSWTGIQTWTANSGGAGTSQTIAEQRKFVTATGTQTFSATGIATRDMAILTLVVRGLVPARHTDFQTYDAYPQVLADVAGGTANRSKQFKCVSAKGGTLETTAITFQRNIPVSDVTRNPQPLLKDFGLPDVPLVWWNFEESGSLEAEHSFSRASEGTYCSATGYVALAATNVPRFTYDPTSLLPRGFMREIACTPSSSQPEDFTNAAWTKTALTVSANTGVGADGATTADKFVPNTTATEHFIFQDCAISASSKQTYSIFVRAAGYSRGRIQIADTTTTDGVSADFNLSAGTIAAATAIGAGAVAITTSDGTEIEYWTAPDLYRIRISGTIGTATTVRAKLWVADSTGTLSFAGNGTSGIEAWGGLVQPGDSWTSYLATSNTIIARADDFLSSVAPTLPAAYTVLVWAWHNPALNGTQTAADLWSLDDGTAANTISHRYFRASNVRLNVTNASSSVGPAFGSGAEHPGNGSYIVAAAVIKADDMIHLLREGTPIPDTAGTPPATGVLANLRLGCGIAASVGSSVSIQRFAIIGRRLSNAELLAIVSNRTRQTQSFFKSGMPRRDVDFLENIPYTSAGLIRLANGKSSHRRLAIVGASYIGNHDIVNDDFMDWAETKFGIAADGYVGFGEGTATSYGGARWAETEVTYPVDHWDTSLDDQESPHRAGCTTSDVGDQVRVLIPAGNTSAKLFYKRTADGGIRYRWNGGAWQTDVNVQTGSGWVAVALTGTPNTTLEIETTAGTVTLGGIQLDSAADGLVVHKLGNNGQSMGDLLAATAWPAMVAELTPDLIILEMDANSKIDGEALDYAVQARTVIARLRTLLPDCEFGMMSDMENDGGAVRSMRDFQQADWNLCEELGMVWGNWQRAFGEDTDAAEYSVLFGWADPSHPAGDSDGSGAMLGTLQHMLGFTG